jgi:hypothetical protein
MVRRISAVAACCSRASLRALVSSEYDGAGGPLRWAVRGVPHAPQNAMGGAFSRWHRRHFIGRASYAVQSVRGAQSGPSVPGRPQTVKDHRGLASISALDISSIVQVLGRLVPRFLLLTR